MVISFQGMSHVEASTCMMSTLELYAKWQNMPICKLIFDKFTYWHKVFFRKQTESVDVLHAEKNDLRKGYILASFTQWRPLNLCNPSPILPRMY